MGASSGSTPSHATTEIRLRPAVIIRLAMKINRLAVFVTVVLLIGTLAACNRGPVPSEELVCLTPNNGESLSAYNLAFSYHCLAFTAGESATIQFINHDVTDAHNVAIYTDSSKSTQLFVGEIIGGEQSIDYDVPALDAGTYYFECNVHPAMNGVVRVS